MNIQHIQTLDNHSPGISALLLQDGACIGSYAHGMANLEEQQPATLNTNYRLASVSKQFTAMLILQLVADGHLYLNDSLAAFFPDSPPFWQHITIEQLLTHSSGLLDYEDLLPANRSSQIQTCEVLTLLCVQPGGYFTPGSHFRYSNSGYCLLALIAEQLSNMPFPDLLHQRIFAPLGMHSSTAYVAPGDQIRQRAYGYSYDQQTAQWQRSDQSVTSATLGDGGIYSSVLDIARWDQALALHMLLPAELQQRMFTAQIQTPDAESYGLGWYLRQPNIAYHTGETIGFRTAIVRQLDRRSTAIVLMNSNEADPLTIALEILSRGNP